MGKKDMKLDDGLLEEVSGGLVRADVVELERDTLNRMLAEAETLYEVWCEANPMASGAERSRMKQEMKDKAYDNLSAIDRALVDSYRSRMI